MDLSSKWLGSTYAKFRRNLSTYPERSGKVPFGKSDSLEWAGWKSSVIYGPMRNIFDSAYLNRSLLNENSHRSVSKIVYCTLIIYMNPGVRDQNSTMTDTTFSSTLITAKVGIYVHIKIFCLRDQQLFWWSQIGQHWWLNACANRVKGLPVICLLHWKPSALQFLVIVTLIGSICSMTEKLLYNFPFGKHTWRVIPISSTIFNGL